MEACVLVWEDDIGWCEQMKNGLAKEGITMQEADNLEALLEGVQKKDYLAAVLSLEQFAEEAKGQRWKAGLSEICKKAGFRYFSYAKEMKGNMSLMPLMQVQRIISAKKKISVFLLQG